MSDGVCVASLHAPNQVKISGFEAADESVI